MNPAELAQPFAEKLMLNGELTGTDRLSFEVEPFEHLNEVAKVFGMLRKPYVVQVERALVLPSDDDAHSVPWQFDSLSFTGELAEYAAVKSPRVMGRKAINALCLSFQNIILHPYEERPLGARLHVPAFAVQSIDKLIV